MLASDGEFPCGRVEGVPVMTPSALRLISASVGTVVYYGFQCNSTATKGFLSLCVGMGVAGSILPFCEWFNMPRFKVR